MVSAANFIAAEFMVKDMAYRFYLMAPYALGLPMLSERGVVIYLKWLSS